VVHSFCQGRVTLQTGDITLQAVDAIVNAANSSLMGGGGVDGAIHRAGGPAILEECRKLRNELWPDGLPDGKAVITTGGNLRAKYVIHTVGPVWRGGSAGEPEALRNCYINSLALSAKHNLQSIAFPAISTGVYRYPKEAAAMVASNAIADFIKTDNKITITLLFFQQDDLDIFSRHTTLPR